MASVCASMSSKRYTPTLVIKVEGIGMKAYILSSYPCAVSSMFDARRFRALTCLAEGRTLKTRSPGHARHKVLMTE